METEIKNANKASKVLSFLLDETYCVLLVKNFEELFLFWRFSKYKISSFESGEYKDILRIRILNEKGKNLMDLPAKWDCGGVYLRLPFEDLLCSAELYCVKNGKEEKLCSSLHVKVPAFSSEPSLGSREYSL